MIRRIRIVLPDRLLAFIAQSLNQFFVAHDHRQDTPYSARFSSAFSSYHPCQMPACTPPRTTGKRRTTSSPVPPSPSLACSPNPLPTQKFPRSFPSKTPRTPPPAPHSIHATAAARPASTCAEASHTWDSPVSHAPPAHARRPHRGSRPWHAP